MNKSELLSLLDNFNFIVEKSEYFINDQDEYIFCSNSFFNVNFIIKEYYEFNQKTIMEDVQRVRATLRSNNINIWNSYYIIFLNYPELSLEISKKVYNVERNSKGLRKYVILQENDLYRIPFIKAQNQEDTPLNFSSNFEKILKTNDKEINELIQWILEEEGDSVEIKQAKLKGEIEKILKLESETL